MLVLERPAVQDTVGVALGGALPPAPSRRAWPVLAMVAGIALVAVALVGVDPAQPASAPVGLKIGGPADVTAQLATYEPGQSSDWHSHTGIHAVTVLSGTITFYDAQCQPHAYGPGEVYVGGQDVHQARNETSEPAQLAVTYIFPAGPSHTTFHVPAPAPAGC